MTTGPGVVLGSRVGPFDGGLDADTVRAYADATGDRSLRVRGGQHVPAVAVATRIWEAQTVASGELVPRWVREAAGGGVHGEHEVVVHRPIVPGERLRTWVEGHGSRTAGRNALVTLRYVILDDADEVVAEQWWSTVYLGISCEEIGSPPPTHAFPEAARGRPVGTYEIEVDDDMARRYAEVSGDWSPHHFEVEAARRSGSDRPFVHGLCTMALCAQGVVELVADGDPSLLQRVVVRFAAPTLLGEELRLQVYDARGDGYAFEADCAGAQVVAHGRAELRGAPLS